ncbi:940ea62d-fbf7-4677-8795-8e0683fe657f [Sclerotinia trifoliorum]|uniref:940ea62d-fbf7-4677-8795-8e0683fe657f n=1 Tax=Sclerotinia trifoliorum TaxID=28548 RepID=A0A8H2VST7_9HELO|nr:940ea62d-fbf7-4677-8795-8e0683fe657f [Sclerotinia trifoliorum]
MGMISRVNHFTTTTNVYQNHDASMGFKGLRRASPCSSLHQLYIESQRGNRGDRYTPTLRRVKSFYNPPEDFALVFAMSVSTHEDSMVEVEIDTSNFVITIEVPMRMHSPYTPVQTGKTLEKEELECPECDQEFMGEYGVRDLAWHFNNVHWKRRLGGKIV